MAEITPLDGDDLQKMFANPDLLSDYLDTLAQSSLRAMRDSHGLNEQWPGHELPDLDEASVPVKLSKLVPPILKASKAIAPAVKPIISIESDEPETVSENIVPVSHPVPELPLPHGIILESPITNKQAVSSRTFEPTPSQAPLISEMPPLPKTRKEVAKTQSTLPDSVLKTGDNIRNLGVKTEAEMAKKLRAREQEIQRLLTDKSGGSISSSSV